MSGTTIPAGQTTTNLGGETTAYGITPQQLITLALKDIGAVGEGETPSYEDINDGYTKLQWMLSQWQRKRWLIWALEDIAKLSDGRTTPYIVGPKGDFDQQPRPTRIESAFLRQLIQPQPQTVTAGTTQGTGTYPLYIDYPLEDMDSWETYSNIALKTLVSFPSYFFYDNAWPSGNLYVYPVPQANIYEVHIQVRVVLNQLTSLTQTFSYLPEEYQPAIHYNLCVRLGPAYGINLRPEIVALAKDSLNVLRHENAQIGRLFMPPDLMRPGIYNPFSDQIR